MQVLYFAIMFMEMSDSASWVYTEARKMDILSIFAEIDFKCIFHYQRTPALVILFQHINKHGNWSC